MIITMVSPSEDIEKKILFQLSLNIMPEILDDIRKEIDHYVKLDDDTSVHIRELEDTLIRVSPHVPYWVGINHSEFVYQHRYYSMVLQKLRVQESEIMFSI